MLEIQTLKKYDKQRMYETYDIWADIARESYEQDLEKVEHVGIDHIIFAGMGGSGALGDIFASILSRKNIHVSVIKGYILPKTIDDNSLVVVTSVSGETEETITVLKTAKKLKTNIVGFSSGGTLEQFCLKNKIPFRKIKQWHSPRTSLPSYLYSILNVLNPILPITQPEITESLNVLKNTSKTINSENLTKTNTALNLASWINGIPIIYYPHGLNAAAIRYKNSLQENSKIHVLTEDVIEACHNNIVAWQRKSIVSPIIIRGPDDYIKTKERWDIIKEFFDKKNVKYKEIISVNGNILSKLAYLIYLLDYSSLYLAIKLKTDPSPVESIDFVKKKLRDF